MLNSDGFWCILSLNCLWNLILAVTEAILLKRKGYGHPTFAWKISLWCFLSRKKLLLIHSELFSFHQNPENLYNYRVSWIVLTLVSLCAHVLNNHRIFFQLKTFKTPCRVEGEGGSNRNCLQSKFSSYNTLLWHLKTSKEITQGMNKERSWSQMRAQMRIHDFWVRRF